MDHLSAENTTAPVDSTEVTQTSSVNDTSKNDSNSELEVSTDAQRSEPVDGETQPAQKLYDPSHPDYAAEEDEEFLDFYEKDTQKAIQAKERGNALFVEKKYEEALDAYAESLLLVEDSEIELRATFHNNKAAAHFMLAQWEDVIDETTLALGLKPGFTKAIHRRARAYEKLDRLSEALEDYKAHLELAPDAETKRKVASLEGVVQKRFEEQKEEMLGKLKEIGNSILGKFGMSLDNFKAVKDPVTGSYSISMNNGGSQ